MGLDDRLAVLARAAQEPPGAEVDVEAALAATRARSAPAPESGHGRRVRWAVAAVLVVLAGVAAVAIAGSRSGHEDVRTGPGPGADDPPAVDRDALHLWLGASQVPIEGGDLPFAIMDPTDGDDTFGVGVQLDRWDGDGWVDARAGAACLEEWNCVGTFDEGTFVRGIGIQPGSIGPVLWVRLDRLDPGSYRLTSTANEGTVAAGRFEVTADAPGLPPALVEGPRLSVQPPIRLTSMSSTIATVRLVAPDMNLFEGWQDGPVRVERWNGTAWVGEETPSYCPREPVPVDGEDDAWAIAVCVVPPGTYRVVIDGPHGPVEGRFWKVDVED